MVAVTHDDDWIVLVREVCFHYVAYAGAPHHTMFHQDESMIPDEQELLRRLREKYTPVTSVIPRENLPYPKKGNHVDKLCELFKLTYTIFLRAA